MSVRRRKQDRTWERVESHAEQFAEQFAEQQYEQQRRTNCSAGMTIVFGTKFLTQ